jgi:hypothetical protein
MVVVFTSIIGGLRPILKGFSAGYPTPWKQKIIQGSVNGNDMETNIIFVI